MLANVLNSMRAVQVSVKIIEIFIKMRELIMTHTDLLLKIEQLEKRVSSQDKKMVQVFNYLKKFSDIQEKSSKKIGYRRKNEK